MFQNKRILVTGASGLIGSNLVRQLITYGAEVIVQGRDIKKLQFVFFKYKFCKKLVMIESDVSSIFTKITGKVDYIFHAASLISSCDIQNFPVNVIELNVLGVISCLNFIKNQKFGRLIVFSSATVYGNPLIRETSFVEEETEYSDCLHSKNSPYSESKRMVEVVTRAYASQYNVDAVIARISYVYGFTFPYPNTAIYQFICRALQGNDITLNNSNLPRRDNIYVLDVVTGLIILALNGKKSEAYNLSSNGELGNFIAIDEIANTIANAFNLTDKYKYHIGVQIHSEGNERKPGFKLNNSKLKNLGWSLSTSFNDGIMYTVKRFIQMGKII